MNNIIGVREQGGGCVQGTFPDGKADVNYSNWASSSPGISGTFPGISDIQGVDSGCQWFTLEEGDILTGTVALPSHSVMQFDYYLEELPGYIASHRAQASIMNGGAVVEEDDLFTTGSVVSSYKMDVKPRDGNSDFRFRIPSGHKVKLYLRALAVADAPCATGSFPAGFSDVAYTSWQSISPGLSASFPKIYGSSCDFVAIGPGEDIYSEVNFVNSIPSLDIQVYYQNNSVPSGNFYIQALTLADSLVAEDILDLSTGGGWLGFTILGYTPFWSNINGVHKLKLSTASGVNAIVGVRNIGF